MRWWIVGLAVFCLAGSTQAQAPGDEALAPDEATLAYCQGVESARIQAFEQLIATSCGPNSMQQTCASAKAMNERAAPEAARRRDFLESTLRKQGVMGVSWVGSRGPLVGGQALAFARLGATDLFACHGFSTAGMTGLPGTKREEACEHLRSCREAYATDLY